MKLCNKKTGEIVDWDGVHITSDNDGEMFYSIAELNEEWEDVAEPLIKDVKIRNAVRAWAKAVGICDCKYDDFWKAFRYEEYSIRFSYKFIPKFGELTDGRSYTIQELCGDDD